jgi:hypothetical protein
MKKIISILLVIITLLSMSACGTQEEVKPELTQMRAICELATLECYYHNVAKFYEEGKNWWDKDKHFWIEYDGVVKIGIDASLITINIDENDTVTITIPEAKVLDCTVNSDSLTKDSYIVDVKSAKITAEDETRAMNEAKAKMLETAKSDKALLISAQERAKELVKNYVENIGACVGKNYNIVWKEADDSITSDATETPVESIAK